MWPIKLCIGSHVTHVNSVHVQLCYLTWWAGAYLHAVQDSARNNVLPMLLLHSAQSAGSSLQRLSDCTAAVRSTVLQQLLNLSIPAKPLRLDDGKSDIDHASALFYTRLSKQAATKQLLLCTVAVGPHWPAVPYNGLQRAAPASCSSNHQTR
jgi:hypothetical protein